MGESPKGSVWLEVFSPDEWISFPENIKEHLTLFNSDKQLT